MTVRFCVTRLSMMVFCCVALGVLWGCPSDPPSPDPDPDPMQQPEPEFEAEPMEAGEDIEDGDSAAPDQADDDDSSAPAPVDAEAASEEPVEDEAPADEAPADEAPADEAVSADGEAPPVDLGLGEAGVDESADFGGRLNDQRFPDTLDNGPEAWPAWRPTHRIEFIEVPTVDSATLEFKRSGGKKLVYGEVYQDGDKFEIRFKLFENGKRIQFDRTQCTWKESGTSLELACKSPSNEIARTFYSIERTRGGWTLTQTDRSRREVPFAPRKITAEML